MAHPSRVVLEDRKPMSVYETHVQDNCDVTKTSDTFEGPFPEYDKYGNLTGHCYKRCNGCGVEVLENTPAEGVAHRDGCRFNGGKE